MTRSWRTPPAPVRRPELARPGARVGARTRRPRDFFPRSRSFLPSLPPRPAAGTPPVLAAPHAQLPAGGSEEIDASHADRVRTHRTNFLWPRRTAPIAAGTTWLPARPRDIPSECREPDGGPRDPSCQPPTRHKVTGRPRPCDLLCASPRAGYAVLSRTRGSRLLPEDLTHVRVQHRHS
jgi:hypothetical protein